jgi:trehalose 6-phosphate phosphatase
MHDAETLADRLIAARATAGLMLVGLDFDGTLAPIVPHPDDAALPEATREVLAALARRADTRVALVSGRSLADLRQRVDVADAHYAGNHGMEIDGPGVERLHPGAAAARTVLTEVARDLSGHLADVDGVVVEDKGLTLSMHYRRVRTMRTRQACGSM